MLEYFTEIYKKEPMVKQSQIEEIELWMKNNLFPVYKLPDEYVELLKESNGGDFLKGEAEYQMFSLLEVVEYYELYNFSEFMPFALPFAMDGCGEFYLFNMRCSDNAVYKVHCGDMGWDSEQCSLIANSFRECICNQTET